MRTWWFVKGSVIVAATIDEVPSEGGMWRFEAAGGLDGAMVVVCSVMAWIEWVRMTRRPDMVVCGL